MGEVCCWEKMSADGKPARGCTRIFTDSPATRKGKREEVLANYKCIIKQELT
jgi:hypothetical protein